MEPQKNIILQLFAIKKTDFRHKLELIFLHFVKVMINILNSSKKKSQGFAYKN